MNDGRTRSTRVLTAVLIALMGCGIAVRGSDLSDGVRDGLSGVIALALVIGAYQLGRRR
jgi:hypothetical protein